MVGAKRALKPQQVWAIRFWLDHERRLRGRAMFDLAIDSKPRGCDVVKIKIAVFVSGGVIRSRAIVIQQKTGRPVLTIDLAGLRPFWPLKRILILLESGQNLGDVRPADTDGQPTTNVAAASAHPEDDHLVAGGICALAQVRHVAGRDS